MPVDAEAPFVGRRWETTLLQHDLALSAAGQRWVAGVAGEPGIGKTRLTAHLSHHAAAEGMVVLQGGAAEAEGMPPYLPFLIR